MDTTRRVFLRHLTQFGIALLGLLSPPRLQAQRQTQWRIRRARTSDAADLADLFNAHLSAGLCPYADLIEPWTLEKAEEFLGIYNGTLILDRNTVPIGFGGLIDYTDARTVSFMEPGGEPEISVMALDFGRLHAREVLDAAKLLGAAIGRDLLRMGFTRCRARVNVQPMFAADGWYTRHMTVREVRRRAGAEQALEVSFDVAAGLAALAQEGF